MNTAFQGLSSDVPENEDVRWGIRSTVRLLAFSIFKWRDQGVILAYIRMYPVPGANLKSENIPSEVPSNANSMLRVLLVEFSLHISKAIARP